jgi:serine/threonine protein kinase
MTFHLASGSSYTITPAESSPEHFWGTIYSAEWFHPDALERCTCAIKASDFLLRAGNEEDLRAEYRRPRNDFEREVRTFQNTKHPNILEMYDHWEWDGRGYIAMKKMKGSLGDVIYEPALRTLLNELRSNEAVLAELLRQV